MSINGVYSEKNGTLSLTNSNTISRRSIHKVWYLAVAQKKGAHRAHSADGILDDCNGLAIFMKTLKIKKITFWPVLQKAYYRE